MTPDFFDILKARDPWSRPVVGPDVLEAVLPRPIGGGTFRTGGLKEAAWSAGTGTL